jgi:hypothetical protein
MFREILDERVAGRPRCSLVPEGKTLAYVPMELLKCVVFLGYIDQKGEEQFAGSAFWISRPGPEDIKNDYRPCYLVTAGHVLEDIKKRAAAGDNRVRIRINLAEGMQKWMDTPIDYWKFHPNFPSMDLAVLKIGISAAWDHVAWPMEAFVSEQSMSDDGRKIELGDELFFAGLFWPHTGEKRNIPIVRIGNVAALRGEPVVNSYGKPMDAYLAESRSVGGLSGSPTFVDVLLAKQTYVGERAWRTGQFPAKFRLMGVIHGHFNSGDRQPDNTLAEDEKLGVNLGIAMIMPADAILKVLEVFVKEEEEEIEAARNKKRTLVVADSVPQSNVAAQVTSTGITIPVPTKEQFLTDLGRTSSKKD